MVKKVQETVTKIAEMKPVKTFFMKMFGAESEISSARVINFVIAVGLLGLMIADFVANKHVDTNNLIVLATYGAGGYGISKVVDYKEHTDHAETSHEKK
jgi:hypothetical protein